MLKIDKLPDVSGSEVRNGNDEVFGFDVRGNSKELAKKSGKSKSKKSKKLSKSQKSAKSGKNLSKRWNLPNFSATETGSNFLTPKTRVAFNCLWLAFTETLIL